MGPTTGATSPQLQPEAAMLESWPSFQEKSEVWVFMYNLFILNVSNLSFFFFFQKTIPQQMCSGFSLGAVQFFMSGLEVGIERGQGGGSIESG